MPTYAEAFDQTLETLEASEPMAAVLRRAFTEIATEWAQVDLRDPLPFSSGVCSDGSPLEMSLRVRTDGRRSLRFIAQPCDPERASEHRAPWEASRARSFLARWGGPESLEHLDAALALYPTGPDPTFTGNFRFWLGLAADEEGQPAAKLYFNPWACLPDSRGALALHVLSAAGNPPVPLERLLPWLRPDVGATPHIVGWNVVGDRIGPVKLYLQAVFGAHTLAEVAPAAWTAWRRLRPEAPVVSMRPRGEVHLALVQGPRGEDLTRLNLFCPDWFRSDEDVVEALRVRSPGAATVLSRLLETPCRVGRRINFVALDPDSVTAYMKVG